MTGWLCPSCGSGTSAVDEADTDVWSYQWCRQCGARMVPGSSEEHLPARLAGVTGGARRRRSVAAVWGIGILIIFVGTMVIAGIANSRDPCPNSPAFCIEPGTVVGLGGMGVAVVWTVLCLIAAAGRGVAWARKRRHRVPLPSDRFGSASAAARAGRAEAAESHRVVVREGPPVEVSVGGLDGAEAMAAVLGSLREQQTGSVVIGMTGFGGDAAPTVAEMLEAIAAEGDQGTVLEVQFDGLPG